MANRRLTMRTVKTFLTLHFEAALSDRAVAVQCGISRRSVAQTLARFSASGLSGSAATDIDDGMLEDRLDPPVADQREGAAPDGSAVARQLARQGVTLKRLWQEWRAANPGGMSDPTWCRQFAAWRPYRDVTMRMNRRAGGCSLTMPR